MEQQQEILPPTQPQASSKKGIALPLFLMLWPIPLLVVAIISYALLSFFIPQDSPIKTITNVLLFIIGSGTIVFGPISFVIGLVLLVQRKSK